LKVGSIKRCQCGRTNYIREGEKCPGCGSEFIEKEKHIAPYGIVFLGKSEISRRTVESLHKEGLIDGFR